MRISQPSLPLLSLMLGAATLCSAASITYEVNQTVGAGSVTGDIVTDGAIGTLDAADIVDWNLLLNDGTSTFDLLGPVSGPNSPAAFINCNPVNDCNVAASSTQLLYDFSGADGRYFIFEEEDSNGINAVCWNTANVNCAGDAGDVSAESLSVGPDQFQFTGVTGTQVIGTAASSSTPEPSTLALLGIGIALLGFRRPAKK